MFLPMSWTSPFTVAITILPFDERSSAPPAARKRRGLSWAKWGKELSGYLATLEKILWPDLIVVGGGVSAKNEKFFKYVKHRAPLVPATFHNQAGIVGAALWAAEQT